MTSRSTRRTAQFSPTASRKSSAVRRAPVAPSTIAIARGDEALLGALVRAHLAKARGEPKAGERLRKLAWSATTRKDKGDVVALVNAALYADGGRTLRQLARDLPPQLAGDVAAKFVRLVVEHEATSAAALDRILLAVMQSTVVGDVLLRVLAGKASDRDVALLARLDGPARLNLAEGLRHAENARREAGPTFDFPGAREAHAALAEKRAARLASQHVLSETEAEPTRTAEDASNAGDGLAAVRTEIARPGSTSREDEAITPGLGTLARATDSAAERLAFEDGKRAVEDLDLAEPRAARVVRAGALGVLHAINAKVEG